MKIFFKKFNKRFLARVLAVIFIFTMFNYHSIIEAEAATYTTLHFINVTDNTHTKGDATLIEYNGHYMLIDGGSDDTYSKLDAYLTNRKITKLDAVVITHNHIDHYGGIKKLVESGKYTIGTIYLNPLNFGDNNSSTNKVNNFVTSGINNKVIGNKVNVKAGEKITYKFNVSNSPTITIYGAIKDYKNTTHETTDENNQSMIVRVETENKNFRALLLGDLQIEGLTNFTNSKLYASEIFTANYDVCKIGHHGMRNYPKQSEADIYNSKIKAKYYVATSKTPEAEFCDKLNSKVYNYTTAKVVAIFTLNGVSYK